MNNETFMLLSKFTIAARKIVGSINPSKLITDTHYANEVFWKVNQVGDEVLVMMSLDLQHQLGMLSPVETKVTPITVAAPVDEKKYLFGARG
jgi:hypothetical protein